MLGSVTCKCVPNGASLSLRRGARGLATRAYTAQYTPPSGAPSAPPGAVNPATTIDPKRNYRNETLLRYKYVQLVDPVSRAIHPPVPSSVLLAAMSHDVNWLELVSPPSSGSHAVVRLVSKRDSFEKAKAPSKSAGKHVETKEAQLSWGVSPADLEHKLDKVRKHLATEGKTIRVELTFATKKQTRPPPKEHRDELVAQTLALLDGQAKEWKPREDDKLSSTLFLQKDPNWTPPADEDNA